MPVMPDLPRAEVRVTDIGNVLVAGLVHVSGSHQLMVPGLQGTGVRLLCEEVRLFEEPGLLLKEDFDRIAPFHSLETATLTDAPVSCMTCILLGMA